MLPYKESNSDCIGIVISKTPSDHFLPRLFPSSASRYTAFPMSIGRSQTRVTIDTSLPKARARHRKSDVDSTPHVSRNIFGQQGTLNNDVESSVSDICQLPEPPVESIDHFCGSCWFKCHRIYYLYVLETCQSCAADLYDPDITYSGCRW